MFGEQEYIGIALALYAIYFIVQYKYDINITKRFLINKILYFKFVAEYLYY